MVPVTFSARPIDLDALFAGLVRVGAIDDIILREIVRVIGAAGPVNNQTHPSHSIAGRGCLTCGSNLAHIGVDPH